MSKGHLADKMVLQSFSQSTRHTSTPVPLFQENRTRTQKSHPSKMPFPDKISLGRPAKSQKQQRTNWTTSDSSQKHLSFHTSEKPIHYTTYPKEDPYHICQKTWAPKFSYPENICRIYFIRTQGSGFLIYFTRYVREEKRKQRRTYAYAREKSCSKERKRESIEKRMDCHSHCCGNVPHHEVFQRCKRGQED